MQNTKSNKASHKKIEQHLKNYHQYKIGIKNIQLQLDNIMPNITVNYELREGSVGTFVINSSTEKCAIDRIESKRAIDLNEQIEKYNLIINCIDAAIDSLLEDEKQFVEYKYFFNYSSGKLAMTMGYGESTIFVIRNRILEKFMHTLRFLPDL